MTNKLALFLIVFLGNFLITQSVSAKKEPLVLKPSSKWAVDYADDSCRLIRKFGAGDNLTTIVFGRFGPGDSFRLTLAGKPLKKVSSRRPALLQFGPSEDLQEVRFSLGTMGKRTPALIFRGHIHLAPHAEAEKKEREQAKSEEGYRRTPIGAKRKAAVTYLSVGRPLRKPIVLKLGPMDKPFAALSTCIDEMLTHWGIDVEKHKTLTRHVQPVGNPGRWVVANDYPRDMLLQGQGASVQFRLTVDKTGAATGCHIQHSTRPKEFDDAVCKSLMKRASFLPALDQEGKPILSYWRNTVRFSL